MNNSVRTLTQLFGVFLTGIGLYGLLKQFFEPESLSLIVPAACLFLGSCTWGLAYALGHSLDQDQAACANKESDEEAAEEGE